MSRVRARVGWALLALAGALVLAAGAGWLWLRGSVPDPARGGVIPSLAAPVEVWRDSLGVPHLWARSDADLFRAVGYVHAQDRLFQMEMFRRAADGRLAEVLGSDLVQSDRLLRTLAMGRTAAEMERLLDPPTRALLQAYADGVNAWLRQGRLPPEFALLRYRPEPWTIRNTLAISRVMAWDLAEAQTGLELQRAHDRVGTALARELHPVYPAWGARILGGAGEAAPAPSAGTPVAGAPLPHIPARAARILEDASIARASNAWVVGPSRTRSGKPILANDMHLSLQAPSLWYLAALHGGSFEVAGMMLPGVPLVIAGHSRGVAWGFSNAMVDDVDQFVERVDPADSMRYATPAGWARFAVRPETIQVKGAEPVVHRVLVSRHGPVFSGVDRRAGGRVMAMRWTAQEPSREMAALLAMNRARSAAELVEGLREFKAPELNVVFADTAGRIGYHLAGRVPVRRGGGGLLPAAGWTGEGDWTRFLEWSELPAVMDPAEGFIVTANNAIAPPGYPHPISTRWGEPFRAQRIRALLSGATALTADGTLRHQLDVRDELAVRYLPHAVRAAAGAGDTASARLLRAWNGEAAPGSRAAALFYAWYEALRRHVGEDEFRGQPMYFPANALNRVLDARGGAWVDDVRTPRRETLAEVEAAAMREAVAAVSGRTWGEVHQIRMPSALSGVPLLDRLFGVDLGPFAAGGSPYTVSVAGYGATRPPFVGAWGVSQRHVVDMGDVDGTGGFIIPTGQSGNWLSPHYRDQTPRWRQGTLWRIPLDRRLAAARTVHRMVLRAPDR